MFKLRSLTFACLLLVIGFATGCKDNSQDSYNSGEPTDKTASSANYFKTQFQTESQFVVEAIVSDLAQQIYYAATHHVPDKKYFWILATEMSGVSPDAPIFELQIRLDSKEKILKAEINLNGPIWSPVVYQGVAEQIAKAVGLQSGNPDRLNDTSLIAKLAGDTAAIIEEENQELSVALENDFKNPELHEKAALLLGAFLLRDHSGQFFEMRTPLSRITAHLAMAHLLGGKKAFGINGQMAEATLLSLIYNEAPALEQLKAVGTNDAAVMPMVRTLRARNTGDYRPLNEASGLSLLENVECFRTVANYGSMPIAWSKLSANQQQTIDFVRAANESGYTVEIGHELLAISLNLELSEINSIYELSHHKTLRQGSMVEALNELPEGCFSTVSDAAVHVHVLDWGQWALFLQRHLCHAIQQNFRLMQYIWCVPEDAKEFSTLCDKQYYGLRLYPFVRRYNCTDQASYHNAVDDAFKVTVATPHLVPAQCWNYLCYGVNFAPTYFPNSNPHINEWHDHNPLPGTDYDLGPRLNHPSLIGRTNVIEDFERLHQLAPYDCRIMNFILEKKYTNKPNYEVAMSFYQDMLPYSLNALSIVADTVKDRPDYYEQLMKQGAQIDPDWYFTLGDYFYQHTNYDKAEEWYDKASETSLARVKVAAFAEWRMRYYLGKGQVEKAREIVDEAGEVYSERGLEAKAVFMEMTSNYDEAFNWYQKAEERYDHSGSLLKFCIRHEAITGDHRFAGEVKKRIKKLFPRGIEKVSLADFKKPPMHGVIIKESNSQLEAAGLKAGDVIVSVYGIRVYDLDQYYYGRESATVPELDLIVWQGDAYREFKPNPPNHRFGVNFDTYNLKSQQVVH